MKKFFILVLITFSLFAFPQQNAEKITLDIKITYDIKPPANLPQCSVAVSKNDGIPLLVKHGDQIAPGKYNIEIIRPGYYGVRFSKIIRPEQKVYRIEKQLKAKSRHLCLEWISAPHCVRGLSPQKIMCNGKQINFSDRFLPGEELELEIYFRRYNTIRKKVVVTLGEGPYSVPASLVKIDFPIAEKKDLIQRRNYLLHTVTASSFSPDSMPEVIGLHFQGEWATVTLSMTACALSNLSFHYPETRKSSLKAIRKLVRLQLKKPFRQFDAQMWGKDALESLDDKRGHIGYLGHLNMMIGSYKIIGGDGTFDDLHHKITRSLVRRIELSAFPYLETYPGEIYTADNMVVYASIAVYDQIYKTRHDRYFQKWISYTKKYLLDKTSKTIVFSVDSNGKPLERSRGSGVGWNSFYLPFVSPSFSDQQYKLIKKHFYRELYFGMAGLQEYVHGQKGAGDIDSGPVIMGLSMSGTGFIMAGARHAGDRENYSKLLKLSNFAGGSKKGDKGKQYLLAPIVGDAIMLAMRTARLWDCRFLTD